MKSIRRALTGSVLAASGMLAAAPADAASVQATFVDLANALRGIAETSSQWSVLPAPAGTFTRDFTLLGVVIAGPTRLALIQRGAGQELLAVGASLGPYRLVDVEESQAVLEGPGGERFLLRLATGGASAVVVAAPQPSERVESAKPPGPGDPNW